MTGRTFMRLRAIRSLLAEPPWPLLMVVTLCGWVATVACGQALGMSALCAAVAGSWYDLGWRQFDAALFLASPGRIGAAWLLMLIAMMTPILAGPLHHLWVRSLPRRRKRAIAVFLAGYLAIWLSIAPTLVLSALLLGVADGLAGLPSGVSVAFLALAWQATPWKQRCLNRCHWRPCLRAFGLGADWDCLSYGIVNGGWCVGTCWALMLMPLAAGPAHLPAMILAAAIMIAERLRPARPAAWRLPVPGRLRA